METGAVIYGTAVKEAGTGPEPPQPGGLPAPLCPAPPGTHLGPGSNPADSWRGFVSAAAPTRLAC